MTECYLCADDNGVWCKVCQVALCPNCHEEHEKSFFESEYLSPHQVYEAEFKGVVLVDKI